MPLLLLLLDRGLSREAESLLSDLVAAARLDAAQLARARAALAEARTMSAHYNDALAAVQMYEPAEARRGLDFDTDIGLRVQLGLALNYTGNYPSAIAVLGAALRDTPEEGADARRGDIYAALSRVYRFISEHAIARDHSQKALEHYRRAGDWRGLAETYNGFALVDLLQGRYESSMRHAEQAAKLIGNRPAPFLLGKIYANLAAACWFLAGPTTASAIWRRPSATTSGRSTRRTPPTATTTSAST